MKRASVESFILFNRQLASMVGLDLPLPDSLRRAGSDLRDKDLAQTVDQLAKDVERGGSLAEAVARRGQVLPRIYAALVRAGEAGGGLGQALRQAAEYDAQMLSLQNQARASMIYPAMLLAGFAALMVLFGILILPRMTGLYQPFKMELPLLTRILVSLGRLLGHWGSYLALGLAGAAAYKYRQGIKEKIAARQFDIPLWNDFIMAVLMARFCKTFGALLGQGVGAVDALALTRDVLGNRRFEEAVSKALRSVESGSGISEALAKTGVFPETVTWLLRASEERGDIVPGLVELGEYYQQAADRRGLTISKMIEPVIIIVMGVVIGSVVIAYFIPMFSLGSMAE